MNILGHIDKQDIAVLESKGRKVLDIRYRKFKQKILCYKFKGFYTSIKMVDGEIVQAFRTIYRPKLVEDWMYHPENNTVERKKLFV